MYVSNNYILYVKTSHMIWRSRNSSNKLSLQRMWGYLHDKFKLNQFSHLWDIYC